MRKHLNIYLHTSEKDYDENDETIFYLKQDLDLEGEKRVMRTLSESRFDTRFEAALINIGEAVVYTSELVDRLGKEKENIRATIYLRNDIVESIETGEHFDIYELFRYMPYQENSLKNEIFLSQTHAKIELNYGITKIRWFDKIVNLIRKHHIKIAIANTTDEQYRQDKQRLDNIRKQLDRNLQTIDNRREYGIEYVFKHLKKEEEKEK